MILKKLFTNEYFIVLVIASILSNIFFFIGLDALFIAGIGGIIIIVYFYIKMILGMIHKKGNPAFFFIGVFLAIILLIFSFASLYLSLYRYDLGNIVNNGNIIILELRESFYFSAVTFFSLGYGDLAPIGLAREVACFEVLLAQLIIIGFFGSAVSVFLTNSKKSKQKGVTK